MKINLNNSNEITIPLNGAAKSKTQRQFLKDLLKTGNLHEAVKYIETFGGSFRPINIAKRRIDQVDRLSLKKEGEIKRLFDEMLDTSKSHRPFSSETNYIGVEIECMIPFENPIYTFSEHGPTTCRTCDGAGDVVDQDGDELLECGECGGSGVVDDLDVDEPRSKLSELFKQRGIKFSSIKSDGSINNVAGYFPVEINVLTKLNNTDNLQRVCKLLNELNAKVDRSCGMHIHFDARHLTELDIMAIGRQFKNALPVLVQCVPETRRENQYCMPRVSTICGNRYSAVNLTAFRKYKTVEIRLHSSTTSYQKIINWARLLNAIMHAPKLNKRCNELNELTEFIYLDENLLEYFTQRILLFSPKNHEIVATQAIDNDEVA
jgi:hypothetical protein